MIMKNYSQLFSAGLVFSIVLAWSAGALATVVPFEESFSAGPAGWSKNSAGTILLDWTAAGGSDGGGFTSAPFNFQNSAANSTPPILHGSPTASGGAFAGDWIADGVTEFSAYVKHDAGMPLSFFMRVAPVAGPGAVGVIFAPVPTNVWTPISWGIFPGNPQTIFEGTNFAQAFSNVGRVQIGVITPAALAGVNQDVLFSLDQPALAPEPGTLVLFSAGLVLAARHARRTRRSS
jgi:hypothetical protein